MGVDLGSVVWAKRGGGGEDEGGAFLTEDVAMG